MKSFIIDVSLKVSLYLGQDGIFILYASLIAVTFLVNLPLSLFVSGYSIKKRVWQPLVCLFFTITCFAICNLAEYGNFIPLLISALTILSLIPIFTIKTKTFKVTEKQRDLVKFIDKEIKLATDSQNSAPYQKALIREVDNKEKSRSSVTDFQLDFQHVKSVISRLDYFGLKECDKKQVKELENALHIAENGEFTHEVKSRINDGLSALLKIMSKYGV